MKITNKNLVTITTGFLAILLIGSFLPDILAGSKGCDSPISDILGCSKPTENGWRRIECAYTIDYGQGNQWGMFGMEAHSCKMYPPDDAICSPLNEDLPQLRYLPQTFNYRIVYVQGHWDYSIAPFVYDLESVQGYRAHSVDGIGTWKLDSCVMDNISACKVGLYGSEDSKICVKPEGQNQRIWELTFMLVCDGDTPCKGSIEEAFGEPIDANSFVFNEKGELLTSTKVR